MKKIFLTVVLILGFTIPVLGAEYHIQKGDSLEPVAKKLGQTVECLKYTNSMEDDIIITGKVLYYVSAEDINRAMTFAWSYALGIAQNDSYEKDEYERHVEIYKHLKVGRIKCSDSDEGVHPQEVLALSEAEKAY